ncbi:MAG TPA: TonB family protein [Acidobacteriaceae bacterium]|nr:TonB family protein [Acidobacteriaceae bacterium]
MFEDSLVESTGRICTRSRWYAAASFAMQAALIAVMILIPYLYPAALPRQALAILLTAPPPPSAPAPVVRVAATRRAPAVQTIALIVPRIIPKHISQGAASAPVPPGFGDLRGFGFNDVIGTILSPGPAPKPPVVVKQSPSGPLRVSSGVADGQLLTPIQPVYPEIAKAAHVQGTVVIDAVISKEGTVEQARVVSGPPLLMQAALIAVERARYRPYELNGQPTAVETTIHIIFSLSD